MSANQPASVCSLLSKKQFLPLFMTQFLGAFNDNAFKLAMLTLISYFLSKTQAQSEQLQALAAGLFILPFFIFSATSGQLADKYDKAIMTRYIKLLEVFLMVIGGIGLFYGNIVLMMCTLTGMGVHSTFFGPIKYAILPQHLPKIDLLGATSLIEGSTFIAILLGTTLGTLCVGAKGTVTYAVILTLTAALLGLLSSWFIPSAKSENQALQVDWNIFRATYHMICDLSQNKKIIPPIMMISWFWFIGVIILTKLPDYANYVLNASTTVFAVFLALFSIGIATGSYLINAFLKGRASLKSVPYTVGLMSIFAIDLYFATPEKAIEQQSITLFFKSFPHFRIALDLFLLSLSGGLFIVPLYTFLQIGSKGTHRSRTIAANNIYNALFMVVASLLVMVFTYFKLTIPTVFLAVGLLNGLAVIYAWYYFR